MERYLLYRRLFFAATLVATIAPHAAALAAQQEFVAEYCTDYSVDRLIKEDNVDDMDLRDQYDLIDKYFADCMTKQKAETHKEATYVDQPVFFN